MHVLPYLMFDGRAEEAIEFYKNVFDAKNLMMMRFKDSPVPPDPNCDPGQPEKVMHAQFQVGDTTIMASDGNCGGKPNFEGINLAVAVGTPADATRIFNGLAEGGKVQMPLTPTFFSPSFGMVADRFGVSWMIMAEAKK